MAPLIASVVDPNGVTKVDDLTVKFALTKPYGPFKDVWSSRYLYMVPEGFDAANPWGRVRSCTSRPPGSGVDVHTLRRLLGRQPSSRP